MMSVVCFTQVIETSYSIDKGLVLNYKSSHNVTDYIECNKTLYQISQSGQLQMKGKRKYFNDEKGIDEYQNATKIDDELVQLFCKVYYEQGSTKYQFGYVTKNGDTLIEYPQFDYKFGYFGTGIPKNVKQIIVGTCTTFALTNTGLYVLGLCSEACGLVDQTNYSSFVPIKVPIPASEIELISYDNLLFIHAKNGDVYAMGTNHECVPSDIFPDKLLVRKIGNEMKKFQSGFNFTVALQRNYYIKGNNLVLFDPTTLTEVIIEQGAHDFYIDRLSRYIIILKEQQIKVIAETPIGIQYTKLYCYLKPTDPQCELLKIDSFDKQKHCITPSSLCKVQVCEDDRFNKDPTCDIKDCNANDALCISIWCSRYKYPQEIALCNANNIKTVFKVYFENAKDYILKDNIMIQVSYQESVKPQIPDENPEQTETPQTQKFSVGLVAGISVVGSAIAFAIILSIVLILTKKKNKTTVVKAMKLRNLYM
ncbi:Regulator_of chromosome condensation 1/beta-lactamase-inhibitor protein II [Hexamita inflata]|uniref:Regulator of chromosome condensation 1/beta-lactamase-inhibitor protein II n=1 Tax=Hexamita inflata TaxID=28002 RepID=A0AA86U6E2_9EUKA|nr:Regulator of chromosome condensation 1/beta-lactamase-inhibitor protein II [Hexamita inflata]